MWIKHSLPNSPFIPSVPPKTDPPLEAGTVVGVGAGTTWIDYTFSQGVKW